MDLNGGLIPVLEFPDGTMIYESRIIMELAEDLNKDKGLQLYSKDPIETAKIKIEINQSNKFMAPFF